MGDSDPPAKALRLSLAEKKDVLDLKDTGLSNYEVARRKGVSEAAIRYILKDRTRYLVDFERIGKYALLRRNSGRGRPAVS
jgi:hypothetical protein